MKYIQVNFIYAPNNEEINDMLVAYLATIDFESFTESTEGTIGYIQRDLFDENALQGLISELPFAKNISYTFEELEDINWNEEWEKNYFQPLIIDNRCIIQSTFHNAPTNYEYNIYIDPKMAFGTGHHQTTGLIIKEILDNDFTDKVVLDMGCGTAILAILASMRGAKKITAIDIDEWAYDNAIENINLNKAENVEIQIGGADLLGAENFDIILANINRNILLNDIHSYASVLNEGGYLLMSGFYTEDIEAITEECNKHGLTFCNNTVRDNWTAVKFKK